MLSTLLRHSGLAPSSKAPPKLFPRFTSHPRSSSTPVSLLPAELPPSISTLHTPSTLVRQSGLAPLPPSYFHASYPIHARPVLRSRSFQRSSPQTISTFPSFLSSLLPSFLSSLLPSLPSSYFHASFLPFLIPSFLPSFFLPSVFPSCLARPALLSRSPRGEVN